jgi:transposase
VKIKKATAELESIVLARGSRLMELHGVGPVVAARAPADVGDVTRFVDRNRFASWTGTAPLDASSGEQQNRHRLSPAGNRRMNHMIHIAAISQIRLDTDGRACYPTRRISDAHLPPAARGRSTRPRRGRWHGSGRALRGVSRMQRGRPSLLIDTSDQPLPGPAEKTLRRTG